MRLIDADVVAERVDGAGKVFDEWVAGVEDTRLVPAIRRLFESIKSFVDNVPTIDAVPVVRCKECKHYQPGKHFTDINFCQRLPLYAEKGGLNVSDDDFCSHGEYSYGERREVDGDG